MNLSNLTGLLFESEGYSRKSRKKIQKNGDRLYYLKAAWREMTTVMQFSQITGTFFGGLGAGFVSQARKPKI
jgi:hypothetical protein